MIGPPTRLMELAALCRAARIFIGSDSGPLHLAAAVGTSCVGLFGTTRAEENGPIGEQHQCVQAFYQEGSRRYRRRCRNLTMRAISIEQVLNACDRVLERDRMHTIDRLSLGIARPRRQMSFAALCFVRLSHPSA